MENGVYNSGFDDDDWHILKMAVLRASRTDAKGMYQLFDELPEHLRASEVGDLIYRAVYLGHKHAANNAAKILTGGSDQAYLVLAKS